MALLPHSLGLKGIEVGLGLGGLRCGFDTHPGVSCDGEEGLASVGQCLGQGQCPSGGAILTVHSKNATNSRGSKRS